MWNNLFCCQEVKRINVHVYLRFNYVSECFVVGKYVKYVFLGGVRVYHISRRIG